MCDSLSLCVSVCFWCWWLLSCLQKLLPAWAGEFKQLASAGEHNESHLCITQNRQLVRFLQQTAAPLGECHLPAGWILNLLYLYFAATHNLHLLSFFLQLVLVSILSFSPHQQQLLLLQPRLAPRCCCSSTSLIATTTHKSKKTQSVNSCFFFFFSSSSSSFPKRVISQVPPFFPITIDCCCCRRVMTWWPFSCTLLAKPAAALVYSTLVYSNSLPKSLPRTCSSPLLHPLLGNILDLLLLSAGIRLADFQQRELASWRQPKRRASSSPAAAAAAWLLQLQSSCWWSLFLRLAAYYDDY